MCVCVCVFVCLNNGNKDQRDDEGAGSSIRVMVLPGFLRNPVNYCAPK